MQAMIANLSGEMSRKAKEGATSLYVRNAALVARIDAWIAKENAANPDRAPWTRASLVVVAINKRIGGPSYPTNFHSPPPEKPQK